MRQNPLIYALHASPDAPKIDAFVGPDEVAELSFGEISAPTQVPPGQYDVDFFAYAAGHDRPQGSPVVRHTSGILLAGRRYLAAATGYLTGQPSFQIASFSDEKALDDADNARLRVVHASPDAPD